MSASAIAASSNAKASATFSNVHCAFGNAPMRSISSRDLAMAEVTVSRTC